MNSDFIVASTADARTARPVSINPIPATTAVIEINMNMRREPLAATRPAWSSTASARAVQYRTGSAHLNRAGFQLKHPVRFHPYRFRYE